MGFDSTFIYLVIGCIITLGIYYILWFNIFRNRHDFKFYIFFPAIIILWHQVFHNHFNTDESVLVITKYSKVYLYLGIAYFVIPPLIIATMGTFSYFKDKKNPPPNKWSQLPINEIQQKFFDKTGKSFVDHADDYSEEELRRIFDN